MGKREVKGDPKDAGLSNRKDRVLCAETEETAGGQNSTAGTGRATRESVPAFRGPFLATADQRSPSACGQGRPARLSAAQQRGPGQEPRLQRSWPKPAAVDALSRGERLCVAEGGGSSWNSWPISEEPVTQGKAC